MMKLFLAFLLIFIPFLASELLACSLGADPPIYEYFEKTDAVFVGKAMSFKDIKVKRSYEDQNGKTNWYLEKERIYQFDVIENFKAVKGKTVSINVGSLNALCHTHFDVGESYLVYANGENEKKLSHQWGANSEKLPFAQDQIHFIRGFLKGQPESQIYGSVFRRDTFPNSTKERISHSDSIKIVLEGAQKFETATDENGYFKFNKIPDGVYLLKPELPTIYRPYRLEQSEKIMVSYGKVYVNKNSFGFSDGYDAFFAEFTYSWNNEVRGRVYDAEGNIVKFASVRLLPASSPFAKIESNWDDDGYHDRRDYSVYGETPGQYYLVAEIYAPFEKGEKIRLFYPQARTPTKATLINLSSTDKLEIDIKLPPEFVTKEVKGTVVQFDGKPVWRASISLRRTAFLPETKSVVEDEEIDGVEEYGYDWTIVIYDGNFVLQGYKDFEYWLHVEANTLTTVEGKEVKTDFKLKPIKIKIGKTNEPLKIVLPKP